MTSKGLLNMLKSMHFPFSRIIAGLFILTTTINFAKISSSQNAKNLVGEGSSVLISSSDDLISSKRLREKFMEEQLKIILKNKNHPLNFLVDYTKKNWKSRKPYPDSDIDDKEVKDRLSKIDEMELDEEEKKKRKQEILDDLGPIGVQAGHSYTKACLDSGEPETVAVEDALGNQVDGWRIENSRVKGCMEKGVIEIDGVIVMHHSALNWAKAGEISEEIVKNAPRHAGYSALTHADAPRSKESNLSKLFDAALERDGDVKSSGPYFDMLSGKNNPAPKDRIATSAPGGIDFSTLELRYIAEDSNPFADRGLRYAFNGTPAAGNKNLNAGRIAAVQASDAFFVWLSLSPDKFWVNLNPNEPDRIIDAQFGKTDAGRILLQSDFQMKKTVAKLIHPDTSLGKQFWQQLKSGRSGTCMSYRQWIVPAPATVRNDDNGIYITDAPLNVKLESQYFQNKGLSGFLSACSTLDKKTESYNESIYRKLILPRIEQAVNTAPEYAELRRVYRSRVAAEWYRQRSASNATTYREMVNNGDVSSWPARQDWSSRQVFDQYVESFTKGEFHVVHSRKWQEGNMIYTQKQFYVYGGVDFTKVFFKQLNSTDFQKKWGDLQKIAKTSMKSPVTDQNGKIWLGGMTITDKAIWKSTWFYLIPGTLMVLFLIHKIRTRGIRLQQPASHK
jgi:hypothetical protein